MWNARYLIGVRRQAGVATWRMHVFVSWTLGTVTRCSQSLTAMEVLLSHNSGPEVSRFVEKNLVKELKALKLYQEQKYKEALVETFKRMDELIGSKEGEEQLNLIRKNYDGQGGSNGNRISNSCGCTANVVLITPNKIITANSGDSRAVLSRKGNVHQLS